MANVIWVFAKFHTMPTIVLCERRPPEDPVFPGQTVFPGGKIEAIDPTPTDAFFREASEEMDGCIPTLWSRWERPVLYHVPIEHGAKVSYMVNREVPEWAEHRCYTYLVTEWEGKIPYRVTDEHAPYPLVWLDIEAREIAGGCDNEIKEMMLRHRCQWNGFTRFDGSWEERNHEVGTVVQGTWKHPAERPSARLSANQE